MSLIKPSYKVGNVLSIIMFHLAVAAAFPVHALPNDPSDVGKNKGRRREITQFIRHHPEAAQAYADRASLKMEAGQVYGAIRDYSTALALPAADKAAFLSSRGHAFLEIGAYVEALQDFEARLQLGETEEALYGRAVAKYHLDDLWGAIRDLDKVVAERAQHPKALFNRALVRMELNQWEAAAADLGQFLEYYPGHAEAQHALAKALVQVTRRQGPRH
ncbi:tetratricopeptide repeat protein [Rufibacter psychrotolerans]|uniref:tetratricopeptide repeat protein n=1 Tax=Rufibacter psychrotolerans TaxID=2812556 RepID=UPI001966D769|nr:hypothetical protein [Rufibacter sp. SYSU D00308]